MMWNLLLLLLVSPLSHAMIFPVQVETINGPPQYERRTAGSTHTIEPYYLRVPPRVDDPENNPRHNVFAIPLRSAEMRKKLSSGKISFTAVYGDGAAGPFELITDNTWPSAPIISRQQLQYKGMQRLSHYRKEEFMVAESYLFSEHLREGIDVLWVPTTIWELFVIWKNPWNWHSNFNVYHQVHPLYKEFVDFLRRTDPKLLLRLHRDYPDPVTIHDFEKIALFLTKKIIAKHGVFTRNMDPMHHRKVKFFIEEDALMTKCSASTPCRSLIINAIIMEIAARENGFALFYATSPLNYISEGELRSYKQFLPLRKASRVPKFDIILEDLATDDQKGFLTYVPIARDKQNVQPMTFTYSFFSNFYANGPLHCTSPNTFTYAVGIPLEHAFITLRRYMFLPPLHLPDLLTYRSIFPKIKRFGVKESSKKGIVALNSKTFLDQISKWDLSVTQAQRSDFLLFPSEDYDTLIRRFLAEINDILNNAWIIAYKGLVLDGEIERVEAKKLFDYTIDQEEEEQ